MITNTPVANAILQGNEGDIDELDLLAEIETAITQTQSTQSQQPSQPTQSIIPTKLYKSSIVDIDDDSDTELTQPIVQPVITQPSNIATTTKHTLQSTPPVTPNTQSTVQSYKRKRTDTPQYSSLEQKTIDEAKLEQQQKQLKQRHAKFFASLTTEQRQRYTLHKTYVMDTTVIRKLLSAICNTSRLGHQVPHMFADALKSAIMYLTETARELQQSALLLQHNNNTNNIDVTALPLKPIEPIYYKLAYLKLQQEGRLPPARHTRHRRKLSLFAS